jgi:hypothetical protein
MRGGLTVDSEDPQNWSRPDYTYDPSATTLGDAGEEERGIAANSSAAGQMTEQTTLAALEEEHRSVTFDGLPYGNDSKTT